MLCVEFFKLADNLDNFVDPLDVLKKQNQRKYAKKSVIWSATSQK